MLLLLLVIFSSRISIGQRDDPICLIHGPGKLHRPWASNVQAHGRPHDTFRATNYIPVQHNTRPARKNVVTADQGAPHSPDPVDSPPLSPCRQPRRSLVQLSLMELQKKIMGYQVHELTYEPMMEVWYTPTHFMLSI
ncbi:hypothetical protein IFM89_009330 [Coptis chinensis]|uniref:Uncharacterized protein n=1 Tax=Coptis chinensis TaxID=261450 RepID=A0A835LMH7_9MAGN|nr:hypothetical protein IFM89_009330 [Coptis chinensis]